MTTAPSDDTWSRIIWVAVSSQTEINVFIKISFLWHGRGNVLFNASITLEMILAGEEIVSELWCRDGVLVVGAEVLARCNAVKWYNEEGALLLHCYCCGCYSTSWGWNRVRERKQDVDTDNSFTLQLLQKYKIIWSDFMKRTPNVEMVSYVGWWTQRDAATEQIFLKDW